MNAATGRFGAVQILTVIGGANVDHVGATHAAPMQGVSNPGVAQTAPGGVGFNVATTLGRLGHCVRLVTRVGRDAAGTTLVNAAKAAGVNTTAIDVSPSTSTASYLAALDHTGSLILGIAAMGILDEFTPEQADIATNVQDPGDAWILDANLIDETIAFLIERAKELTHTVVALAVSPIKAAKLKPHLGSLDLIFANRNEALVLLGIKAPSPDSTAETLAAALHALGPEVVITDAGEPVAVASGGDVRTFKPLKATIRSVNGAGDALAAGTLHGLADGRSLFDAIPFGLAAAALTMEHEATVPPSINAAALADRLILANSERSR